MESVRGRVFLEVSSLAIRDTGLHVVGASVVGASSSGKELVVKA